MMSDHKYYAASQQLRDAQMAVRYDTVTLKDSPHGTSDSTAKTKG
jgi:predicted DNA-binding WGR domain protein